VRDDTRAIVETAPFTSFFSDGCNVAFKLNVSMASDRILDGSIALTTIEAISNFYRETVIYRVNVLLWAFQVLSLPLDRGVERAFSFDSRVFNRTDGCSTLLQPAFVIKNGTIRSRPESTKSHP
jgi:hypothetical protein